MEFISHFSNAFIFYIRELWWSVLLGFFLSGLFNEFIPSNFVDKYLSKKGLKPILISSLVGMILPVCCFGSLPIAVTLRKKGARLGPVLAFLVATPATSISALIVSWKLMGAGFTAYIFTVVVVMGVVIGYVGNCLKLPSVSQDAADDNCCGHAAKSNTDKSLSERIGGVFVYAFYTLPKEIGIQLLIGVAIASLLLIFEPLQNFINQHLIGMVGYVFLLIVGLLTYVCSTASVPMADALIKSGMTPGQSMIYLLVGPITSYGTLIVLHKEFGGKILTVYLLLICFLSLLFGVVYDIFI